MALQNPLLQAPTEGLTGCDVRRIQVSLDSSVSDNTRAVYNSAWRSFRAWAQAWICRHRRSRSPPT